MNAGRVRRARAIRLGVTVGGPESFPLSPTAIRDGSSPSCPVPGQPGGCMWPAPVLGKPVIAKM